MGQLELRAKTSVGVLILHTTWDHFWDAKQQPGTRLLQVGALSSVFQVRLRRLVHVTPREARSPAAPAPRFLTLPLHTFIPAVPSSSSRASSKPPSPEHADDCSSQGQSSGQQRPPENQ